MYLTSLFKDKAEITYTYTKRRMQESCAPDLACEQITADLYNAENGNLFAGRAVSWKGYVLLNGSVDINIQAKEEYFIDHITLTQTEVSKLSGVEIFTNHKGEWKKIGGYALPGDALITEKTICIPVGAYGDNVTVRLNGGYEEIGLENLEIHAVGGLKNAIYPTPKCADLKQSRISLDSVHTVAVMDEIALPAAKAFMESMQEEFGTTLTLANDGEIVFSLCEKANDGYEIETTETGCRITAGNKRAFFYAAYTLLQTVNAEGIRQGTIKDEPMMDMRGFHLALPARQNIPFLKKVIKELLVPMRYNMIFLQISGAMRYDKYPEINEKWLESCERYEKGEWPQPAHYGFISRDILEKDEVAELCAYIRSFHQAPSCRQAPLCAYPSHLWQK